MLYLEKGGSLNLTKDNASLTKVNFALGWSGDTDPDAFAICLRGASLIDDDDVLYYNSNRYKDPVTQKLKWVDDDFRQPYILKKAVVHSGDARVGGKEGDDEVITVDLKALPQGITHIAFCVNIFEAIKRRQTFRDVQDAFIRLDNAGTDEVIAQYDLNHDAGSNTGVVLGYLAKDGNEWVYNAKPSGFDGDINAFCSNIHKLIGIRR